LTHESCNKSKQDANLKIARILHKLKGIQEKTQVDENKAASLKHVLSFFNGSKYNFKYKTKGSMIKYSFSENGDNDIYQSLIFKDKLSKTKLKSAEKTCFIEVPIEYNFS